VIATCVDAMMGCASGRLAYVVISEGGVAGVGETLRRLPWSAARADGERLCVNLGRCDIAKLDELPKDHWPGR
jgi:hypothetical protein